MKCLLALLLLCLEILPAAAGEAAALDRYRQILLEGRYTIEYHNITPAERVTNRDRVHLFGRNGLAVAQNDYLTNRPRKGLIVSRGEDRYEEVGDEEFASCRLTKGGEDFFFTKYKGKRGYEYFGTKKNQVTANNRNYLAEVLEGKSYGDEDMSRLINALLSAGRPQGFKQVAAGTLAGGVAYEDYQGKSEGRTQIIRCYFTGGVLTKIAAAEFAATASGTLTGHKCIIAVKEFAAVPREEYLSLPDGLADVTKRKGAKQK